MQYSTYDLRGLAGPPAEEDGGDGAEKNLKIEEKGPLVDVLEIELHPIREIVDIVTAGNLPQTSHAGEDTEAPALGIGGHGNGFIGGERARTDQAHLPKENIKKLGQFIEGGETEKTADASDARIFLYFKDGPAHLIEGF